MDNDKLAALAKQWESDAVQYERRNRSINRSACFDGKRQLNVGLAVASRAHAEALRELLAESEPSRIQAVPTWMGVDMAASDE